MTHLKKFWRPASEQNENKIVKLVLTGEGICSYFRLMAQPIDTIGKAVRCGMLVKATCKRCGNFRCYKASDLMMIFGGGRDPLTLNFRCGECKPAIDVTLIDVDLDRMRSATIYEPFWMDGKVVAWMATRLR